MTGTEERLADALAATAATIDPAVVRPLPAIQPAAWSRGRARHTWLAPVAASVSIAIIAAAAGILSHHALGGGQKPAGAGTPTAGQLQGIDALSSRDIWAVGDLNLGQTRWSNLTQVPLIVHWDGTSWRRVAVPAEPGGERGGWLTSVAGTSADNVWAVGMWQFTGKHPDEPIIMHWDGTKWRLERFAAATKLGNLQSVSALSPDDAWAVGARGPNGPLVLHWNGIRWSQVAVPAPGHEPWYEGVTPISADDAWAVGNNSQEALTIHWNGSSWTREAVPQKLGSGTVLLSVSADSAGTVWAEGFTYRHGQPVTVIMRWTGSKWKAVPSPALAPGVTLAAVSASSPRSVWAVGGGGLDTVVLHWNGRSWSRISGQRATFHGGLNDLAIISADNIWTVGYLGSGGNTGVPQILHWNGTAWKRSYGPATTGGLLQNSSCGPYHPCSGASSSTRPARRAADRS